MDAGSLVVAWAIFVNTIVNPAFLEYVTGDGNVADAAMGAFANMFVPFAVFMGTSVSAAGNRFARYCELLETSTYKIGANDREFVKQLSVATVESIFTTRDKNQFMTKCMALARDAGRSLVDVVPFIHITDDFLEVFENPWEVSSDLEDAMRLELKYLKACLKRKGSVSAELGTAQP